VSGALRILVIEDNPGDARLIQEALLHKGPGHIRIVQDGVQALEFLRAESRPQLILLDLNLPRKDGREVLSEIKRDPDLQRIPVVVLTTSDSEEDIERSYQLHANCFVTKPVNLDRFLAAIRAIEEYWFGVVKLPPR
jgi:two-component system, chemotaxis family, response regulator Rcp1